MSLKKITREGYAFFLIISKRIYTQYDTPPLQFFWFPLSLIYVTIGITLHNLFSSHKRFLCSELIAAGFHKEGDYLFNKPQENVLPADFDNPELFEEIRDIWFPAP